MAIDKAVDSSVLEAGLTAIANAIREKGGTSDTLAFPDAMAEAIAAIETGGGEFNTQYTEGSFTPSDNIKTAALQSYGGTGFEVSHNSGFVPKCAVAWTGQRAEGCMTLWVGITREPPSGYKSLHTFAYYQYYSNENFKNGDSTGIAYGWTESKFSLGVYLSSMQLKSGVTVYWRVYG